MHPQVLVNKMSKSQKSKIVNIIKVWLNLHKDNHNIWETEKQTIDDINVLKNVTQLMTNILISWCNILHQLIFNKYTDILGFSGGAIVSDRAYH